MTDAQHRGGPPDEAPVHTVASPPRRGRPPKGASRSHELRGTVVKRYTMTREDECTVGHLRRIVGQRDVPDGARITLGESGLTIEWSSE